MNFEKWLSQVPSTISSDRLWRVTAYRISLFAADIGWHDVTKLVSDKRTVELSNQLYSSLGSIGANLAEGYSRSSNKDRARFYEYALGSARECRDWYYKSRHVLGDRVSTHRINLLSEVIRLLLTMVPEQRFEGSRTKKQPSNVQETPVTYGLSVQSNREKTHSKLGTLLQRAPFPN